ncbi:MAG TPA: replication factor C large subunit, partial [Thermoplasmata archaeon]|nr:replication factor C large subunit [Thermoplasmata archaeon]
KPGTGKTSTVLALANEYNWIVIELNASDVRSAEKIKKVATYGALNETFTDHGSFVPVKKGGRKLILLDEADNLYERRSTENGVTGDEMLDKGGKKAIVETIKETKQPIILVVNDLYELTKGGGEALKDLCLTIRFSEKMIPPQEIETLLRRITTAEGIHVDAEVLTTLAERCKGDVRSAVRDLQSLCIGKTRVERTVLSTLGYRDRKQTVFEVLHEVFKTKNIARINRLMSQSGEDPKSLIYWIDENLPRAYLDTMDLAKAYRILATADMFLRRAEKHHTYILWKYAVDLMGGGVATVKKRIYSTSERYQFPSWLKEMKTTKSLRETKNSIAAKIGNLCHCSSKKANDMINVFQSLCQNNETYSFTLKDKLQLTEDEIRYLTGPKYETLKEKFLKKEEDIEAYEIIEEQTEKKELEQQKLF